MMLCRRHRPPLCTRQSQRLTHTHGMRDGHESSANVGARGETMKPRGKGGAERNEACGGGELRV
jgi:hypothetical protein